MAETLGRQGYIDALNLFFDNVASAFVDAGGEILSFIGDGFLAVFPCGRNKADSTKACQSAYGAAREAMTRMQEANNKRFAEGQDVINFGIGLHIGNVMFGNVGLEDRLAFSAFGATVNEASPSRISHQEIFNTSDRQQRVHILLRCRLEQTGASKHCAASESHLLSIRRMTTRRESISNGSSRAASSRASPLQKTLCCCTTRVPKRPVESQLIAGQLDHCYVAKKTVRNGGDHP